MPTNGWFWLLIIIAVMVFFDLLIDAKVIKIG